MVLNLTLKLEVEGEGKRKERGSKEKDNMLLLPKDQMSFHTTLAMKGKAKGRSPSLPELLQATRRAQPWGQGLTR